MRSALTLLTILLFACSPAYALNPQSGTLNLEPTTPCDERGVLVRVFGDCGLLGLFDWGSEPPPTSAIPGWTHRTQALDATGDGIRIDIGGGAMDHADLSTFNPDVLTPGSVVNIWHRSTPYNTVHLFHKDGTEEHPITIHGVTDGNGTRPIFDCTNRQTGVPAAFGGSTLETYGFFVLSRTRDGGSYGDPAEWNTFQNLHIRNCAASIRTQSARHTTIQHNIIDSNHNGIFFSDAEGGSYSAIVRGNYFTNNGSEGNYLEHSIYFQGLATSADYPNIIEGNFFDEMLPTATGMQIKTRATDTIIRYNTVLCQRLCLEIGELQNEVPGVVYSTFSEQEITDRVNTSYIYGNQFYINDTAAFSGGAVYPFHIGVDTGGGGSPSYIYDSGAQSGRNMSRGIGDGMTYFYHNSISIVSSNYHQSLFGLGYKDTVAPETYGNLTAINNAFRVDSTRLGHLRLGGELFYEGRNLMTLLNTEADSPRDAKSNVTQESSPDITITGDSAPTLVIERGTDSLLFTNPAPTDSAQIDFRIDNQSSAKGTAETLPSEIPLRYHPTRSPIPPYLGGGASTRTLYTSVGAHE